MPLCIKYYYLINTYLSTVFLSLVARKAKTNKVKPKQIHRRNIMKCSDALFMSTNLNTGNFLRPVIHDLKRFITDMTSPTWNMTFPKFEFY